MTSATPFKRAINIVEDVDIALVIVAVRDLARHLTLDDVRATRLATAASELASNIAKYARWGTITFQTDETKSRRSVILIAQDRGPGIADLNTALTDHFSTGGSLGLGLPGVKRLLDEFKISTEPGHGCTITGRMWLDD